jgi:hypothetical protein
MEHREPRGIHSGLDEAPGASAHHARKGQNLSFCVQNPLAAGTRASEPFVIGPIVFVVSVLLYFCKI